MKKDTQKKVSPREWRNLNSMIIVYYLLNTANITANRRMLNIHFNITLTYFAARILTKKEGKILLKCFLSLFFVFKRLF